MTWQYLKGVKSSLVAFIFLVVLGNTKQSNHRGSEIQVPVFTHSVSQANHDFAE